MKSLIKKFTPKVFIKAYHFILAKLANLWYHKPSEKLIVIGVTGTSGKSTVVYLISQILEKAGFKVGVASTILFKVAKKEKLNDKKMTMIGRFALQKLLQQMVKANCQYAIIETTSQGIEQFRHLGINYDILVFTNLYPEHIEAHGNFVNYKKAKLKLFKKLENDSPKMINKQKVNKIIIANLDDPHAVDFLNHKADEKYGITLKNISSEAARVVRAENVSTTPMGMNFSVNQNPFELKIFGQHNVYNALSAITVGRTQGLDFAAMTKSLASVTGVPGRFEFIEQGQKFKVLVDYAFEPKAMTALYEVINNITHKNIIHVLGGTGGGRDKARRPIIGEIAGQNAKVVIVTDEDPYDEDPQEIINQVAAGAKKAGKTLNKDLYMVLDRREAIKKAFSLAKKDDIVIITGKGSEQGMVVKNNKIVPWDDRRVAIEELQK